MCSHSLLTHNTPPPHRVHGREPWHIYMVVQDHEICSICIQPNKERRKTCQKSWDQTRVLLLYYKWKVLDRGTLEMWLKLTREFMDPLWIVKRGNFNQFFCEFPRTKETLFTRFAFFHLPILETTFKIIKLLQRRLVQLQLVITNEAPSVIGGATGPGW